MVLLRFYVKNLNELFFAKFIFTIQKLTLGKWVCQLGGKIKYDSFKYYGKILTFYTRHKYYKISDVRELFNILCDYVECSIFHNHNFAYGKFGCKKKHYKRSVQWTFYAGSVDSFCALTESYPGLVKADSNPCRWCVRFLY